MSWRQTPIARELVSGSVFFSIRRTGILNLDNSNGCHHAGRTHPRSKPVSSLHSCLPSDLLFRGTLQVPNRSDWCCHSISRANKTGLEICYNVFDHWTAAMILTNTQFANRGEAQQKGIYRKRIDRTSDDSTSLPQAL